MYIPNQRSAAPWSQGNYWGQFSTAASLPNRPGAASGFNLSDVQAGDVAWVTATNLLYVCVDPTPGAAVWDPVPSGEVAAAVEEGNTVTVDSVFGNDATASRQGLPFATIAAAIAVAQPGDLIFVRPGIYNVGPDGIAVPDGVSMRGASRLATKIQIVGATQDTTLLTMGESTRVEELTFELTSSEHHTLIGALFAGGTAATAKIRSCQITVDNSAAPAGSGSTVIGIHSVGTGAPPEEISSVRACNVIVTSRGIGEARAVLVDTNTHTFRVRDSNLTVDLDGAGSAIAGEVDVGGGVLTMRSSLIDASAPTGTAADISETNGSININATTLVNSDANGLGFTNSEKPALVLMGAEGNLSGTRFLSTWGSGTPSESQRIQFEVARLVKSLILTAGVAPVGGTIQVTVRIDGVDTPLTATIPDGGTSAGELNVSVRIPPGGRLSMRMDASGGADDLSAQVEVV